MGGIISFSQSFSLVVAVPFPRKSVPHDAYDKVPNVSDRYFYLVNFQLVGISWIQQKTKLFMTNFLLGESEMCVCVMLSCLHVGQQQQHYFIFLAFGRLGFLFSLFFIVVFKQFEDSGA